MRDSIARVLLIGACGACLWIGFEALDQAVARADDGASSTQRTSDGRPGGLPELVDGVLGGVDELLAGDRGRDPEPEPAEPEDPPSRPVEDEPAAEGQPDRPRDRDDVPPTRDPSPKPDTPNGVGGILDEIVTEVTEVVEVVLPPSRPPTTIPEPEPAPEPETPAVDTPQQPEVPDTRPVPTVDDPPVELPTDEPAPAVAPQWPAVQHDWLTPTNPYETVRLVLDTSRPVWCGGGRVDAELRSAVAGRDPTAAESDRRPASPHGLAGGPTPSRAGNPCDDTPEQEWRPGQMSAVAPGQPDPFGATAAMLGSTTTPADPRAGVRPTRADDDAPDGRLTLWPPGPA